jgi:hypothetical protein
MNHCSTVEERISMVSQMLARRTHGLVMQLSHSYQVSRQTLYRWEAIGRQALEEALGQKGLPVKTPPSVPLLVLNLLLEAHASYRGIQATLRSNHGIEISLGTIAGIIKEAGHRAQQWMKQQQAQTARTLALDEQYSSQRGKAYLNVIDVHSGQVWATIPPVKVDSESWMLVLWYLQEQGITWCGTVSDGGRAIADALCQMQSEASHQRDVWHLFHLAAQVQARLERVVETERDRLSKIQRRTENEAQGKRTRGKRPKTQLGEQQALVAQMSYVADSVGYLCHELHTLLEVVVVRCEQTATLLNSTDRHSEIATILDLLDELVPLTTTAMQGQITMLAKQIRLALPHTLLFARRLDGIQRQVSRALGAQATALLAWAWLRRSVLGPSSTELLQSIPSHWQAEASQLLSAWDQAVRASSAVENWHSIVRPHLAVHRTLSAGMLALLAVKQNHQVAPRGLHEGLSPLQRTGSISSDIHWLAALGYSPNAA